MIKWPNGGGREGVFEVDGSVIHPIYFEVSEQYPSPGFSPTPRVIAQVARALDKKLTLRLIQQLGTRIYLDEGDVNSINHFVGNIGNMTEGRLYPHDQEPARFASPIEASSNLQSFELRTVRIWRGI